MNQTEYADHRGVSQQAISALVKKGKLDGALVPRPSGKRMWINPEKADEILDKNLHPAKRVDKNATSGKEGSHTRNYAAANTELVEVKTAREKLKLSIESGEAVYKKDVERAAETLGRSLRDAVLNVKDRILPLIKPLLSDESDIEKVSELLDEYEDALGGLAKG